MVIKRNKFHQINNLLDIVTWCNKYKVKKELRNSSKLTKSLQMKLISDAAQISVIILRNLN